MQKQGSGAGDAARASEAARGEPARSSLPPAAGALDARDHRKLGQRLSLFALDAEIGGSAGAFSVHR